MKIACVEIENLRSFRDRQVLEIAGNLCVLVGPNGGGKTNLLDAMGVGIRRHVIPSWQAEQVSTQRARDAVRLIHNNKWNDAVFLPHSESPEKPPRLTLTLVATRQDIEGIQATAQLWREHRAEIERRFDELGSELKLTEKWAANMPDEGSRHLLIIENRSLRSDQSGPTRVFREYLNLFDRVQQASRVLGSRQPQLPMVAMPANRAAAGLIDQVVLSSFNEIEAAQASDAGFSRSAPQLAQLALGRLAKLRRQLEVTHGDVSAAFGNHPTVNKLTHGLGRIGYEWELRLTNPNNNTYQLYLKKEGRTFPIGDASAGERELLTYFFALHALEVRDALVLVDEPELHLHPRWQKRLFDLFSELSTTTGNQFIIATHSPAFISPESVHQVHRIASIDGASKVISLRKSTLPARRHLVRLVNALNVERIFFCDAVILVEGITDRVVFEQLLMKMMADSPRHRTIEVVEAQGKSNFAHLSALLRAFEIPHAVIADRDVLRELAPQSYQRLFEVSRKQISRTLFAGAGSRDSDALFTLLEEAVSSGDTANLAKLLEHQRIRHRGVRADLSPAERSLLDELVGLAAEQGYFVLIRGAIEAYLPTGTSHADLNAILDMCDANLENSLDRSALTELRAVLQKAVTFTESFVPTPSADEA